MAEQVLIFPFCFFKGKNVVHQLGVSLEDLYNGITRKLALQKNVICAKCEGKKPSSGFKPLFRFFCVDCLGLRKSGGSLTFLSPFFLPDH